MLAAVVASTSSIVLAGDDAPAPTASFTVVPNPAGCQQALQLDASTSSAAPGRQIVSYAWNFGDSTTATGVTVNHAFTAFGSYSVTLTVTDDNVPAKTASTTTVVNVNQGNRAPIANAGGPYIADLDAGITLDASGSTDPDAACGDSIASYAWDLDNDGAFDDGAGSTTVVAPATLSALGVGPHPIRVQVTDEFGATSSASTTLTMALLEIEWVI
jgi:PKD repeat protein